MDLLGRMVRLTLFALVFLGLVKVLYPVFISASRFLVSMLDHLTGVVSVL